MGQRVLNHRSASELSPHSPMHVQHHEVTFLSKIQEPEKWAGIKNKDALPEHLSWVPCTQAGSAQPSLTPMPRVSRPPSGLTRQLHAYDHPIPPNPLPESRQQLLPIAMLRWWQPVPIVHANHTLLCCICVTVYDMG